MKKFLILFLLATFSFSSFSQNKSSSDVYVKSYTRSNGTVVKGYYRTAPNSTNRDNFSTRGNVNPYTGQAGYVKPDKKANTSTYSYSSSSNSSQINNSKTATFKNGKWIIPSASEKNSFQDGTMYCNGCQGGGSVSNVQDQQSRGVTELKKLSKIEFNGSGEGIMSFYKRGDDMSWNAFVHNEDSKTRRKSSSEPFAGVLKMDASNMVLEDDKHIFIDDGLAIFNGNELDIILERQIILTLSFRIFHLSKGEAYYIFSPSQLKVLSMFNMKEILFRVNRKYIDKKTGKLNEEGEIFNYVSKITTENTKELFIN